MQITRNSIDTQKRPADWFTGDVYIDAVAAPAGSSTSAAALVHFTPGARTAWHTHPHGQTICNGIRATLPSIHCGCQDQETSRLPIRSAFGREPNCVAAVASAPRNSA